MSHLGDLSAGHVLGRYELLMPIASGGMATVWAARIKGTRGFQKIVAVKTMLPQLSEDPLFEQMFLDEASLASRIRHPHVAEIQDLGEEGGVLFLVMEWVDGEPLSVVLKTAGRQGGGIPLPITVRILSQACAGLHAAHELRDESGRSLDLVHRDASPQNILVTFEGVVKVVDFGVAKAAGRASPETNAGQIKGKAAYMSPEQVRGGFLDRRTDVFALGTMLYLMTTGKHPFRGENDVATLYNIADESPVVSPSRVVPHYPRNLELVVEKALAKNANDRYASADEMQRALTFALPESERIMSDTEVAAFINHLIGERHVQREKALKSAMRVADERSLGRMQHPSSGSSAEISHSGFTPPSNVSGLIPPPELRSGTSLERRDGSGRSFATVGPMTTGERRSERTVREPYSSTKPSAGRRVTLAALVALLVAGGGFAISWRSRLGLGLSPSDPAPASDRAAGAGGPPGEAPSTNHHAASNDASASPASSGSAVAAEGAADAGELAEIDRDAGSDGGLAASRIRSPPPPVRFPGSTTVASQRPTPSSTRTTPSSTSTSSVPPVRNPGF